MVARRLILWDVDGTLVRLGPLASSAFASAVQQVVGRDAAGHGVSMGGKTDPQIAREIMAALQVPEDEADGHLSAVLTELERQLSGAEPEFAASGRTLPGVPELLRRLHDTPGVTQTVLTGNLAANARVKVAAFGLDAFLDLDIGAYGSDDHDRLKLVPIALEKAARVRELRFEPDEAWVIGDTLRDLACARAGGARCLLVRTGRDPLPPDEAGGADAVLSDLTDGDRVLALMGLAT
ncbi:MAG TPA: HAD family hydrolase [Actinomycetota bacterium]|jgi:phosphoglycolate phosphatase-like HAD superfamily hydrolase